MSERIVDGRRMKQSARELAFPRYPGTGGNRKAADLVARWFRDAGLQVDVEPFCYDIRPAMWAVRAVCLVAGLLLAASGSLAAASPARALGLLGAGIAVGGILLVWAPAAERMYAAPGPTETWNVSGSRRGANPMRTLIFVAHYDSKSQNLGFAARNGPVLLAMASGLSLALYLVASLLAGRPLGPAAVPLALALPGTIALLVLSTLQSGNASPGGVDNAGSVAILRELAAVLPPRVPPGVDLIFLSTGAEEDHMVGAMRWLDAHLHEFSGKEVFALNFDGCGAPGRPVSMERCGLFRSFAPRVAGVARETADRLGIPLRRIWLPPAMGVDAIPFLHRGLPCLTLASGSLGRATLAVHTAGDSAENLDPETLEACALLALETAVTLASG